MAFQLILKRVNGVSQAEEEMMGKRHGEVFEIKDCVQNQDSVGKCGVIRRFRGMLWGREAWGL